LADRRPPDLLVVDEAHHIKNPTIDRSRAVAELIPHATRVLLMTGTPLENQVEEFQNLVAYLNPRLANRLHIDSSAGRAAGFRRRVAPVYLRRNQQDVVKELPEKLDLYDWVELDRHTRTVYEHAVAERNWMAMRQAAFRAGPLHHRTAKLQRLTEIIDEAADNEWKVVIFSWFRDTLRTIHHTVQHSPRGPVMPVVTGSTSPDVRQRIVEEYSRIKGHAVLIGQTKALGEGLNIQAASVVVLAEPQDTPTREDQAIARCQRIGQPYRVRVHRLLSKDSVDERLLEILAYKIHQFDLYARDSHAKHAYPAAIDPNHLSDPILIDEDIPLEKRIIIAERRRLGLE
jgi:SNF2 family DNA or RNA helicase